MERWLTRNNEFHSSLVIVPTGAQEAKRHKLTPNQQKVLDTLIAGEPGGLLNSEWDRLSALRGGSFGDARKALERLDFFYQDTTGRAHPTDEGRRHHLPNKARSTGTTDHYETTATVVEENYYGHYGCL